MSVPDNGENVSEHYLETVLQRLDSDVLQYWSALQHLASDVSELLRRASPEARQEIIEALVWRAGAVQRSRRAVRDLLDVAAARGPDDLLGVIRSWPIYRTGGTIAHSRTLEAPALPRTMRTDDGPSTDFSELTYVSVGLSFMQDRKPGQSERLWAATRTMLTSAGYEVLVEGVDEPGSVFKRWALTGSKRAAKKLAEAGVAAANDTYVRKPGAEATAALVQATATMLDAMGDEEGVHAYDNLLIGKMRGDDGRLRSFSQELTLSQRKHLNEHPALLRDPVNILHALTSVPDDEGPPTLDQPARPALPPGSRGAT